MAVDDYSQLYTNAAQQYGLDPALLMAQAQVESSGNPRAYNEESGTSGLAQLTPATAKSLGVSDPTDPKQAIDAQAKLMAENLTRYKDPELALMAYHGGTNQANWGPKTKAYPGKVFANYKKDGTKMASNEYDDGLDAMLEEAYPSTPTPNAANTTGAPPANNVYDDGLDAMLEEAYPSGGETKKIETDKSKQIGYFEDLVKTLPSSVVKGIGAIPQMLGYGTNLLANSMGEGAYGIARLAGHPKDEALYQRLTNINPIFTGNTIADPLMQAGSAIMQQPASANPLSGNLVHDPQTGPGRYANAIIQTLIAGKAGNAGTTGFLDNAGNAIKLALPAVKTMPLLGGALSAETANEYLPGSPTAQFAAGLAGGTTPTAISSLRLTKTPETMAHNALQQLAGQDGGNLNALLPANINSTEIVPGSKPTLAQVTGNSNLAAQENQIETTPAAQALEKSNEAARQQYLEKATGTPQDVQAMKAAREAERDANTKNIFQPQQVADASPVVAKIDEILNGPGGERSAVRETLNKIRSMIVKKEGTETEPPTLQDNPEKLYRSVKGEIEDLLDKKNLTNAAGRQSSRELLQVKAILDNVIEDATPGYNKYLDDYSNASAKIDAAEWLQGLKLTDGQGNFTLAKVKTALENARKLQKTPGINDAKHLAPDQIKALQDLHDDLLRRDATAQSGRGKGSPTKKNFMAEANKNSALSAANELTGRNIPEMIGSGAGAFLGSMVGQPGPGSFLGNLAARAIKHAGSRKLGEATNRLQGFLLNPEDYKQFLMNQSSNTYSDRFLKNMLSNP